MTARPDVTCAIPDCQKRVMGRGWCSMHYARWRKYGDPLYETRRYAAQGSVCSVDGCERKPHQDGMCYMHVRRLANHGETTDPPVRKFWAQVDKDGPLPDERPDLGPCWVWTGCVHKATGYGLFGARVGSRLVHRIAYQYVVGPIPKGLHLDHLCRRRLCLRPDHLEPVTPRENIRRGDQGAFWGYVPEPIPAKPTLERSLVCTEPECERPVYKRTICRAHYRAWLKDPSVVRPSQRTPEQRFWSYVDKTGSCWLWTGSVNAKTGYARFMAAPGRRMDAHRYAFELANGSIPEGHDVHHACHVRHCVRPDHLQATTRSENLRMRKVRR